MGSDSRERRQKYIGLKGRATPGALAVLGARLESVVRIQRRATAPCPMVPFLQVLPAGPRRHGLLWGRAGEREGEESSPMALAMTESGKPSGLSRGVAVFQSENEATSEDLRPEMEAWNQDPGGGAAPGCQGRDPAPGRPGWGMSTPTESGAEGPLGWDRAWSPNGATREGAAQHGPCRKRQGLCREEERGFDNVETGGPTHGGVWGRAGNTASPQQAAGSKAPAPGTGRCPSRRVE